MYYFRVVIPVEVENVQTQITSNHWYAANTQTETPVPTTTSAIPGTPATSTTF